MRRARRRRKWPRHRLPCLLSRHPPASTAEPAPLPAAVEAALQFLAQRLGVPASEISVVQVSQEQWPNACLGAASPDEVCAQVVTPGYRVILTAAGRQYEVHTDDQGVAVRLAESPRPGGPQQMPPTAQPAIEWERSGGIAGICQRMLVQGNGLYVLTDCAGGKQLNAGALPVPVWSRLAGYLARYGSVDWQSTPPPGSADMFTDHLVLRGSGSETPSAGAAQTIDNYLGEVATQLAGPAGSG